MRKIYGLMGALLALSIGGYLLPEKQEALPGRILMPNAGGRVVFDHGKHLKDYEITCVRCHHDAFKPEDPASCMSCHDKDMGYVKKSCKSCHGADFGGDFKAGHQEAMGGDRQPCTVCHHAELTLSPAWKHEDHTPRADHPTGMACSDCHHDKHGVEPGACRDCHTPVGNAPGMNSSWRLLKDAAHARCAECHGDYLKGDVKNCAKCHDVSDAEKLLREGKPVDRALTSCSTCHEEAPKKLVPGSMAAYHGLCIGCHTEKGGPTDECAQCHRK